MTMLFCKYTWSLRMTASDSKISKFGFFYTSVCLFSNLLKTFVLRLIYDVLEIKLRELSYLNAGLKIILIDERRS